MAGSMMDWLKKLWARWFGKQSEPPQEPDDPPELEDSTVVDTPLDTGEDPVAIAQSALSVDEPEALKPPNAPDVPEPTRVDATAREVQETAKEPSQPLEPDDPPELEDAPVVDTPLDTGEDPVSIAQSALDVDEPKTNVPESPSAIRTFRLTGPMGDEERNAIEDQMGVPHGSTKRADIPVPPDIPEQNPVEVQEQPRSTQSSSLEMDSPPSVERDIDPGFDLLKQAGIEPSNAEDPGFDIMKSLGIEEPETPGPIQELDVQDPPEIKTPPKRDSQAQNAPNTTISGTSTENSRSSKNVVSGTLPVAPLPKSPHATPEFTSMDAAGLDVPEIRGTRPAFATSSTTPQNRPERQTVQPADNPPQARQTQAEQATDEPEAAIQPPPDPETFQPVEQPEVVFEELNREQRREDTQTARQQKQRDRQLAVTNQARQRKGMAQIPAETDAPDAESPEPADIPPPPRSQAATQPQPQLPAESGPEVESGGSGEVVRVLEEIRDLLEENRELAEKQVDAIGSLKEALKNSGGLA